MELRSGKVKSIEEVGKIVKRVKKAEEDVEIVPSSFDINRKRKEDFCLYYLKLSVNYPGVNKTEINGSFTITFPASLYINHYKGRFLNGMNLIIRHMLYKLEDVYSDTSITAFIGIMKNPRILIYNNDVNSQHPNKTTVWYKDNIVADDIGDLVDVNNAELFTFKYCEDMIDELYLIHRYFNDKY